MLLGYKTSTTGTSNYPGRMSRDTDRMVHRLALYRSSRAGQSLEARAQPRTQRGGDGPVMERHHRNVMGGAARAAVFGMQDGLVSNVAIILGVAGDHPVAGLVRVVGLALLASGALSMAAGEYVSMQAQKELFERELSLERREIRLRPEGEQRELAHIYERRGLSPTLARQVAGEMMSDPDKALETHAREELGISPDSLGSPWQAAASSFLAFAFGALLPLLPWFFATGHAAIYASIAVGALGAIGAGAGLSVFTGQPRWRSVLRQLVLTAVIAGVTYSIGVALGVSGVG